MDSTSSSRSRSKLVWGFVLLSAACALHATGLWWAVRSSLPLIPPGSSVEELTSALRATNPGEMMARTMLVQGISTTVFMVGVVVLAMGVVEYAAEVWRREG